MKELIEQINDIEFPRRPKNQLEKLELACQLISQNLSENESEIIQQDFDCYCESGKYIVKHTFVGGLIYLPEPETICGIKIGFSTELNNAIVSVAFSSESENTNREQEVVKVEKVTWNMLGIFPNFSKYETTTKVYLMAVLGNLTKRICEGYRIDFKIMEFKKEFNIELYLDEKLELTYHVRILNNKTKV